MCAWCIERPRDDDGGPVIDPPDEEVAYEIEFGDE